VLKENGYEPASRTLRFSPGEVAAYRTQLPEWSEYFTRKDAAPGLPANYIQDPGVSGVNYFFRNFVELGERIGRGCQQTLPVNRRNQRVRK